MAERDLQKDLDAVKEDLAKLRSDIAERVTPLLRDAPERRFSEPNRWGTGELEQAAVRPELVAAFFAVHVSACQQSSSGAGNDAGDMPDV